MVKHCTTNVRRRGRLRLTSGVPGVSHEAVRDGRAASGESVGPGWAWRLLPAAILTLLLGHGGCLNPRPEEEPSVDDAVTGPPGDPCAVAPAPDSCSVPVRDGEGTPPPQPGDVDEVVPAVPAAAPPPADASAPAAVDSDAGAPVDPADAQAP
ncbi:MAG TPA: hypothetical protein VNN80_32575 [Polyangiaceae bacterium]|nr:hypothetical protein [Polyangiaceae bacterium]